MHSYFEFQQCIHIHVEILRSFAHLNVLWWNPFWCFRFRRKFSSPFSLLLHKCFLCWVSHQFSIMFCYTQAISVSLRVSPRISKDISVFILSIYLWIIFLFSSIHFCLFLCGIQRRFVQYIRRQIQSNSSSGVVSLWLRLIKYNWCSLHFLRILCKSTLLLIWLHIHWCNIYFHIDAGGVAFVFVCTSLIACGLAQMQN